MTLGEANQLSKKQQIMLTALPINHKCANTYVNTNKSRVIAYMFFYSNHLLEI